MSVIFFGTPDFAVPSLNALVDSGEDVSLVVCQPDKKKGREKVLSPPPVKIFAVEKGIPVLQPAKLRESGLVETFRSEGSEFIVVAAYGKILPADILGIPQKGCINVHGSLLPAYRGAAPIQWSIINGDPETGITTMLMDQGMDTGDILLQRSINIREDDNAGTLSRRLSLMGAELLLETLRGIRNGSVHPVPQSGAPSFAPPLKKEDGRINWTNGAAGLFNFVRGMFPWPGAFSFFRGKYLKVLEAGTLGGEAVPGDIAEILPDGIAVGTGERLLVLRTVQPEGKRPMDAKSFVNGYRVLKGEKFD